MLHPALQPHRHTEHSQAGNRVARFDSTRRLSTDALRQSPAIRIKGGLTKRTHWIRHDGSDHVTSCARHAILTRSALRTSELIKLADEQGILQVVGNLLEQRRRFFYVRRRHRQCARDTKPLVRNDSHSCFGDLARYLGRRPQSSRRSAAPCSGSSQGNRPESPPVSLSVLPVAIRRESVDIFVALLDTSRSHSR